MTAGTQYNLKMSHSSKKRKASKTVDVSARIRALRELKNGTPASVVAKNLQVHVSTVNSWRKKEDQLLNWLSKNGDALSKSRKRLKSPENYLVDKAVWIWLREHRTAKCSLSGAMLRVQALLFHQALGGSSKFEASQGWLTKWQKRHGIGCISISEKVSPEVVQQYQKIFAEIIRHENLSPEQIFTVSEMALNYRQLPKIISVKTEENVPDMTSQKERITVMVCSNAAGTFKLPLFFTNICTSEKSQKVNDTLQSPIIYKNHTKAWMTGPMFDKWFNEELKPQVIEFLLSRGYPPKAALFMDNCCAHPVELSTDTMTVHFFPPNVTSVLLPMNQGCLQHLKTTYRKRLMAFIVLKIDLGSTLSGALQEVTINEVIHWVVDAWLNISSSTIIKSWRRVWPQIMNHPLITRKLASAEETSDTSETDANVIQQFCEKLHAIYGTMTIHFNDVNQWVNTDQLLSEEERLTDQEIIEMIREDERLTSEENDEDDNDDDIEEDAEEDIGEENVELQKKRPSIQQAREALQVLLDYCEGSPHYTESQVSTLYGIQQVMAVEFSKPLTQSNDIVYVKVENE